MEDIKKALKNILQVNSISFFEEPRYTIAYINESTKWICRIVFDSDKTTLHLPVDSFLGHRVIDIKSSDDIYKYKDMIQSSIQIH